MFVGQRTSFLYFKLSGLEKGVINTGLESLGTGIPQFPMNCLKTETQQIIEEQVQYLDPS